MPDKLTTAFTGWLLALTSVTLAAAPITLVENGKPAATIVIADQPTNAPHGQQPPPAVYEAELARQWQVKTQSYTVATVAAVPADAAAWATLPAATLAQGQYGTKPDQETRVRLVRCGTNVFARFEAAEPVAPMIIDRLAIFVKGAKRQPALWVNGEGDFPNYLPQKLAGYTYADGVWAVVLKCQASALGLEPGQAKTVEVQFERKRGARGKAPATDYYWAPPMRPQSPEQVRFGRLDFE